jgi:predicted Zn-dependent peptidase
MPAIETLSNGMRALLLPDDANDIVALTCFIPLPGAVEGPEDAGTVGFALRMLMRGTASRTAAELAEAVESLGSSIHCDAADDFSAAHMICTSDAFAETIGLFCEVLTAPSFEPEEVEKERQSTLAAIRRGDDDKFAVTMKRFVSELYGVHPYGVPRTGTEQSVSELKRDQLTHLFGEFLDPAAGLAVCVGNFDPAEARARLEGGFARRGQPVEPLAVPPLRFPAPASARFSRECEQAFLMMGYPACPFTSPDYPALRVLNGVLGEGMSSRLFVRLRDEQGLAYATGSTLAGLALGGHLAGYIGTKPESLDTARDGMRAIFEGMRAERVPADELERAKNYIIGKFLIDHQTNARRGYYLGYFETMGLGAAMDEAYPARIASVTADQVVEAARKYITAPTIVELVPPASPLP